MQVERPYIKIFYENVNITEDISRCLIAFNYTDHLTEADTLDIDLEDIDAKWQNEWFPEKGAKITAEIGIKGKQSLSCGTFEIDEIEFIGPPDAVSIRCISTGYKKGSKRTLKAHVHENKTLREIIDTIADKSDLDVIGDIEDIRIGRKVQQNESDLNFLYRISKEYGYTFNVRHNTLIFMQSEKLDSSVPVIDIYKENMIEYSFRDKSSGTYKGASIKYHNSEKNETIHYTESDPDINGSDDFFVVKGTATGKSQAIAMSKAALNEKNRKERTGKIIVPGHPILCAGNTIMVYGIGRLSGKYLINSTTHSFSNENGWITEIEIDGRAKKNKGAKKKQPIDVDWWGTSKK